MTAKWGSRLEDGIGGKIAACEESLKLEDQALDRPRNRSSRNTPKDT